MAFARFVRDSIDRDQYPRSGLFGMAIGFVWYGDRCCGNSLASRVNAIDPYEILRCPKHPFAIVNILGLWMYVLLEIT